MEIVKKYTLKEVSDIDKENRKLVGAYSATRIKIGLELAKRLKIFKDSNLYLKLDEASYPTFPVYLRSLDIKYKTAMEVIGLYETYVLTAGMSIDELAEIGYHKLTKIKPRLFVKKDNQYKLIGSKSDLNKWIRDAKSDMTQEDLSQKLREEEVGEHDHDFKKICYKVCKDCGLKEYIN